MKLLMITFLIILLTFNFKLSAENITGSKICLYVQTDNKNKLRHLLKSNKIKIRNIHNKLKCNGKSILLFASDNNSENVGKFVVKKLSKKILIKITVESNIKNIAIKNSIENRINK